MTTETGAEQGAAESQSATEDQDVTAGAAVEGGETGADEGAGESGAATDGGEAGAEAAAAPSGEAEPPAPPKKKSAAIQARFDELTREKHEALREAESYKAEIARLKAGAGDAPAGEARPGGAADPQLVPISEVPKLAAHIAAQNDFAKRCNDVYDAGEKAYGDEFEDSVKQLQIVGALSPQNTSLIEAAMETDAAAQVLHHLGQDPDEAARIAKLPPVKLAAEVVKLAAKLTAPKPPPPVSKAPSPIAPVGGSAAPTLDIYDPKLSDDEYYARRAKQGAKFVAPARA